MTISLTSTYKAVAAGISSSFLATGGKAPYVYSIAAGGAGGTIIARTGVYTAPAQASSSPNAAYDTINVSDSLSNTAVSQILVGTPLMLFCDIIQTYMGLANGRVFLWDQKLFQPTDYDIFVVVSVPYCRPFGNNTAFTTDVSGNVSQVQSLNMYAHLDVDIISRGPAARDQKEQIILALGSVYAEQQMEANGFFIGRLSNNFVNLSDVDGAAIPYRYRISCAMQYGVGNTTIVPSFNNFPGYTLITNS